MAGITLGTAALVNFGKKAIEVASDITEVQNVVDVTFGSMAKDINDFASSSIKEFGLSTLAAKKYSSSMGAMLKSSGIAGKAVKDMSIDLAKLSADMASFYNLENEEAFRKIMSGMSGMTMPLKELGINMNIANLENFAMAQGIRKSWQEMNQAEQTMLRYNYLLNVTSDSQGDFARNAGTWANQVKILKMQWEEFMSLIGKALVEILLPVVKFLNKTLEILIAIAKQIGKIYAMITGKEVVTETNTNIGESADFAAGSEEDLAKGIGKAAKAAKKALAPFDELNLLQQNLGSGGAGAGGGLGGGFGDIDTKFGVNKIDDGMKIDFKELEEDTNRFYIWFMDKWTRLREFATVPMQVPAPIFATIPDPIYRPNWGLELPPIKKPTFPPIPSPVYRPNWGLDTPKVPAPVFMPIPNPVYEPVWNLIPPPVPAVDDVGYVKSLEEMKVKTSKVYENIKTETEALRKRKAELWGEMRKDTEEETGKINTGLAGAWAVREKNYETHKGNLGVISAAIAAVTVANLNSGLMTSGRNTNTALGGMQSSWNIFGKNTGLIAAATGLAIAANLGEGLKVSNTNFGSFYNSTLPAMKSWGVGMLKISAEVGKGILDNIVNSLSTAFRNIIDFAKATGEKVSGWFSANKSVITKVAIGAGIAIGAGALALAAPAAIPYVVGGLGGLATVPALAKGGITDVNAPFLAVVGDNKTQREVVSPLDDLMGMITSAVGTAIMETKQFDSRSTGGDIILQIDGTTFARIINPYQAKENERIGNSVVIQTI